MIALDGDFTNMGAMLLRHVVWGMHEAVGDGGATAARRTVADRAGYLPQPAAAIIELGRVTERCTAH